jgi:hypothetical protein
MTACKRSPPPVFVVVLCRTILINLKGSSHETDVKDIAKDGAAFYNNFGAKQNLRVRGANGSA